MRVVTVWVRQGDVSGGCGFEARHRGGVLGWLHRGLHVAACMLCEVDLPRWRDLGCLDVVLCRKVCWMLECERRLEPSARG